MQWLCQCARSVLAIVRSFGKFDQAEKDLQITRMQKNMIHRDLVPLADTVMRDADRDICPIVDTTAISDFVPRVIDCQSGFRQNANGVRATVRGFRLMYIQSRRRDTLAAPLTLATRSA